MPLFFRGCRNIRVVDALPVDEGAGSLKRFIVAGADEGNGTYGANPQDIGSEVHVTGASWTLTVQAQPTRVD